MRALLQLVGGFVAGMAVGYVVAVLLAPDEGAETLERVRSGATALRTAPHQVQARLHLAVEEGQRAAAATRADLEATAGGRPASAGTL
jgi:gas vesicle protein